MSNAPRSSGRSTPIASKRQQASAKEVAREVYFADRAALRAWLAQHHASHVAIWLVYDKQRAGVRGLTYDDIVEEALCFGWIDSVAGRVSEDHAKLYFSPRKPKSVWSALNKRRVASLLERGLMTPAGQSKIDAAKRDGSWTTLDAFERLEVPGDLAKALKANSKAKAHFDAFPPGACKQILYWVGSAKRPETRAKRVAEAVRLAAENVRANQPAKNAR
jgi:uncharacterized protein YdeI (YjbR/CyaY-like superfamily)